MYEMVLRIQLMGGKLGSTKSLSIVTTRSGQCELLAMLRKIYLNVPEKFETCQSCCILRGHFKIAMTCLHCCIFLPSRGQYIEPSIR